MDDALDVALDDVLDDALDDVLDAACAAFTPVCRLTDAGVSGLVPLAQMGSTGDSDGFTQRFYYIVAAGVRRVHAWV